MIDIRHAEVFASINDAMGDIVRMLRLAAEQTTSDQQMVHLTRVANQGAKIVSKAARQIAEIAAGNGESEVVLVNLKAMDADIRMRYRAAYWANNKVAN